MTLTRHKTFLSYHHEDSEAVGQFIAQFDDTHDSFITRGIRAPEDLINSDDPDYVMGQIRRRFLADSTVTICLIGACTWSRRFVDWEIQASLRQPAGGLPNGLLAILLDPNASKGTLPSRVKLNWESGYAAFHSYPSSASQLAGWIDSAYAARTNKANLIKNPRDRFTYNRSCG
ncbi:TIR domain-containing protein [Microbacterium aurum]